MPDFLPHVLYIHAFFHGLDDLTAAYISHSDIVMVHHDKTDKEKAAEYDPQAEGAGTSFLAVPVNAVVGAPVSRMHGRGRFLFAVQASCLGKEVASSFFRVCSVHLFLFPLIFLGSFYIYAAEEPVMTVAGTRQEEQMA